MNSIAMGISLFLTALGAVAQEGFSGEFQLKAKAHIEGLMLAPDYRLVVDGGNATVKFNRDGQSQESKGTVTLSILSGIDPATRRAAKFSGFLRVEIANSGWAQDRFITRIEIPIQPRGGTQKVSGSPDPQPVLDFAATASVEMLTLDVLSNGIRRYTDPMGVRMRSDYEVDVIKNPIK